MQPLNQIISPIQSYLEKLLDDFADISEGEVASYIPALSMAKPEYFGISIVTVNGHRYEVGDSRLNFSIQSMSKPFTYGVALEDHGIDHVLSKVGVEPSGDAFNSISLHPTTGSPMNPMINAGAIASAGMVTGSDFDDKLNRVLDAYGKYAGRNLEVDEEIYTSESSTGHRNRAIAYMLRNFDILTENPDDTLELYFKQCSINVNCCDLAVMAATLANNGINPVTQERALDSQYIDKVLSVMSTCGMYDYAGGWIYDIGLPAKSGVAGGVLAVLPGQFGIGIYSPPLDRRGNSVRGIKVCEKISTDFNLHIYNVSRESTGVIRAFYDGVSAQSNRIYSAGDEKHLKENAHRIKIWELQGDIIFGSVEFVINEVIKYQDRLDYCILDFKRVLHINYSAITLLIDLIHAFEENAKYLILSNTDHLPRLQSSSKEDGRINVIFPNRFEALEWCEIKILELTSEYDHFDTQIVDLSEQLLCKDMNEEELAALREILVREKFTKGDTIIEESDDADCMYFVEKGEVSVQLKNSIGKNKKIASLSAGTAFGEMALIERKKRSASVVCESDVTCLRLDFTQLDNSSDRFSQTVSVKLITNLAHQIAKRLRLANETIRAFD